MKSKLLLPLSILLSVSLISCGRDSSQGKLKDVYKNYFRIGAAINDTTKEMNILNEFSSFTAENAMKWEAVHPLKDRYSFENADTYIETAKKQKAGMRGHALVWHEALPSYVFYDGSNNLRTKEEILEIEKDHVRNVVTHFSDSVYCWDVVNEVINDNQTTKVDPEDETTIYRQSQWYELCGKDFIKVAFETADQTLKDLGIRDKVQLIYNDYYNTTPVKRDKTIAMLDWFYEENIPIDGVGLQCHYHLGNFNMADLEESIEIYANHPLNLDVQITEFDVEIYDTASEEYAGQDFKKIDNVPEANMNMHASIYDRALEICRRHKDQISAVTFWGTTDAVCYMNSPNPTNPNFGAHTNYPFLFDRQNKKKPCYYAISEFGSKLNKTYNPYKELTANNNYDNSGNDAYLSKFSPDNMQIVSRPTQQADGSYKVDYTNVEGYNYLGTTLAGRYADFAYINILAKGQLGKSVTLRLYHSGKEMESYNLLGSDCPVSLDEEFSIHTLKIKSDYRVRMDLATKLCIYPEIGIAGAYGEFYYKDIWFSKEIPEGATLENPGVDSGDTSKTVNGWSYETWTGYTLYRSENGTGVTYIEAKDYAYINYTLDIQSAEDNALEFSFINVVEFNRQTVSHIRFLLRGDVIGQGVSDDGYDYDIFIESVLYTYNIKEDHVLPDENGVTTLHIPLVDAVKTIGDKHVNGYHLTVMIESFAPEKEVYDASRDGTMIITDCHLYDGGYVSDKYSQTEDSEGFQYVLSDKDGVDKNVTYTDVRGNKYWPVIYREVESTHDQEIEVVVRNNGEATIKVAMHAGVMYDARTDEHNHFFYPLWEANKGQKNQDGYFLDGQNVDVAAGESYTFIISVDEDEMYANDSITTLEFLFDNCWGDSQLRSGDVDILSVTVRDKSA